MTQFTAEIRENRIGDTIMTPVPGRYYSTCIKTLVEREIRILFHLFDLIYFSKNI